MLVAEIDWNHVVERVLDPPTLFFLLAMLAVSVTVYSRSRKTSLKEKMIDPTKFLVWFIESYPKSFEIMKKNPNYQEKFL